MQLVGQQVKGGEVNLVRKSARKLSKPSVVMGSRVLG